MNLIETFLNLLYVYTAHVSQWSPAPMIGFSAALMTLSKTLLYVANDYFCTSVGGQFCYTGHNSAFVHFVFFVIPNG